MYRPLELFIGLRYIRAKRRNQFISFVSLSSMLGIALGVTALITVLSVMNGFITELRDRILGMTAHITVSGYAGEIKDWHALEQEILSKSNAILGIAPYISAETMLSNNQKVSDALIRKMLPSKEPQVSTV